MIPKATVLQVTKAIIEVLVIAECGLKKANVMICVEQWLADTQPPTSTTNPQVTHCLALLLRENAISVSPQTIGPGNRTYRSISKNLKVISGGIPPYKLEPIEFVCFSLGGPLPVLI